MARFCFAWPMAIVVVSSLLAAGPVRADEPLAPHEIARGIFAHGSSARLGSANIGWIVQDKSAWIVGAPNGELLTFALEAIKRTSGQLPRGVILTGVRPGALEALRLVAQHRIPLAASRKQLERLRAASQTQGQHPLVDIKIISVSGRLELNGSVDTMQPSPANPPEAPIQVLELHNGDAAVWLPGERVLFAGDACVNGPRAELAGRDTSLWIDDLAELEQLTAAGGAKVVPGAGTLGDQQLLTRQRGMLTELRRQVAWLVSQARPLESIKTLVSLPPEWLVWMPYDQPTPGDIEHVYHELTVPQAPFGQDGFDDADKRPRALALIGDRHHDPQHLEVGLRRAFAAVGIAARFAYDVRALSAENLKQVQLLVMLRDGMLWPDGADKPCVVWMTPEQERAVVEFVHSDKALLALHNSTGLYPEQGPYLKLLGGTYQGHGPLERFRVDVVDSAHPITRGVAPYEIADEQHTPTPDLSKVHVLLTSRSDDGVTATAGWAYETRPGRVAYLANGHTREAMLHPMYQRLMQNAMRWCLRLPEADRAATGR